MSGHRKSVSRSPYRFHFSAKRDSRATLWPAAAAGDRATGEANMPSKNRPRPNRRTTIETLEVRQVMAADPLAGLVNIPLEQHNFGDDIPQVVLHPEIPAVEQHDAIPDLIHHVERDADFRLESGTGYLVEENAEQHLDSAHNRTGLDTVRENYGFTGIGQTVVVIDSGIAFDHYALGGGFGAEYRVVGGWDFTEDDADPYDDGPEGSHGTHVAGIIGSSGDLAGNNEGVAPGVDLVGLRVFNDSGNGSFTDISNALQWVIDNHDAFENPVTAINLSLGTTWNAAYAPSWASFLESRFQQIENLGIFIAVSAGNSFSSYNVPGLSYPAASKYVVPVMSVDDSGSLSYYSQRHANAIAAPGRNIRSTIPDYAGNNNNQADDWANFSGTSMAAPYVAGASVLVRQAMELIGYTNINQDTIYEHMRQTADTFFDSVTSKDYSRLNLSAAIDALLPDDDYGSTVGTAHDLGAVSSSAQVSGMISTLSDIDYFTFTAGTNGVATFSATNSHQLDAAWDFGGATATLNGSNWEMNVSAGQTYTVGISTQDGLGFYDVDLSIESTFAYIDWSSIAGQQSHTGISNAGESWYRIVAGQSGYVTAQAAFAGSAGNIDIALYDANMQMVDQSAGLGDAERIDYLASEGNEFYLQVTGANTDIDIQLTNMVSVNESTVSVMGTAGDDTFSFTAGATHELMVNGVGYSFSGAVIRDIDLDAGTGTDDLSIAGTSANETVRMYYATTTVTASAYSFSANGFDNISMHSGGGQHDRAYLYDTGGDEHYSGWHDAVYFTGNGFSRQLQNFDYTIAYSTAGNDTAEFYDTSGNDTYVAFENRAVMYGNGFMHDVHRFASTTASATLGFDMAIFHDGAGDELYHAESLYSRRTGDGFSNEANGFNYSIAYSGQGDDLATMSDSDAYDIVSRLTSERTVMYSSGTYYNDLRNFSNTQVTSTDGIDRAVFNGESEVESFQAWSDRAEFSGNGASIATSGFSYRVAFAGGGNDVADFHDSTGNDTYVGFHNRAVMYGTGYYSDAFGFATTRAYSTSGIDKAIFHDSSGDDVFWSTGKLAWMSGTGYRNEAHEFSSTRAHSTLGNDTAYFYDTANDDIYVGWSDRALMYGSTYRNEVFGFEQTEAFATTGNDLAVLYTSAGEEEVIAESAGVSISDGSYNNTVRGFGRVNAFDLDGDGGDDLAFADAVDYIFNLYGDWS